MCHEKMDIPEMQDEDEIKGIISADEFVRDPPGNLLTVDSPSYGFMNRSGTWRWLCYGVLCADMH